MGRGNVCVFGEYEGLYYLGYDKISGEYEDMDGNIQFSYDVQRENLECMLDDFCEDMTQRFPSMNIIHDAPYRNDGRLILENNLFEVVIEDTEWAMAIKLIQKESWDFNLEGLQSKHYVSYLEGMKTCLFHQVDEIGTYGGAWTHGTITKQKEGVLL